MARKKANRGLLTAGEVARMITAASTQIRAGQTKPTPMRRKQQAPRQTSDVRLTRQVVPAAGGDIVTRPRGVPRMNTRGNTFLVCNTELVIEGNGSAVLGGFTTASNLTHPSFCTWLGTIAQAFSKFRWIRARYIYIPGVPTNTTGRITLGMSYDTSDNAPGDMLQASAAYKAVSCPVWAGYEGSPLMNNLSTPVGSIAGAVAIDIDTARFSNPWYKIQTAADITAMSLTDRNMYVPCQLYLSSQGLPVVSGFFGSVYLQYEVEFIEPIATQQNA
jgi:hypothetical protein